MPKEEYIEKEQKLLLSRTAIMILIGIGAAIFLFLAIFLAMRLNWKIVYIREHFWQFLKRGVIVLACFVAIVWLLIEIMNYVAKAQDSGENIDDREVDSDDLGQQ